MKHLRVLEISSTSVFVLPESVCTLYQLQVLRIKSASSLPKRLNNLVSLRYLEANSDLISGIPDIGKLTSLQGLKHFQVKKEKGYELEQLQNLNELRGRLCIDNLENVESRDSAIAANLKEKEHLDMLQLVWRDGEDNVNSDLDVEILEGLQLPPYLTSLSLDGYRGRSCPSWPECQTSDIQEFALTWCGMLEALPLMMDQIYRSCISLELSHLPKLKALHALPPQLTILIIENTLSLIFVTKEDLHMSPADKRSIIEVMRKRMPKWFPHQYQESLVNNEKEMMNFIAATNDSNNEACSAKHNKSAPAADVDITAVWGRWLEVHERKMELIYSRQNEAKLLLPSTLTELWLKGCNITNRALSASLQTLTSLTRLSLEEIRTVTRLPSADVLGKLTSLQAIILRECWAITSLGETELSRIPHSAELLKSGGSEEFAQASGGQLASEDGGKRIKVY
ncbi:putative disease resistance RPP13-like protein 1 [Ananas comosus]|uniref:Putative disease resistance RPP13-like protein 1 n=1 Tax=Ananas comosus TaxID=4615 RepID=A0A199W995_ANACO|nr:putative disease resistance RPP13-like protein 1 [Ananas comosus]